MNLKRHLSLTAGLGASLVIHGYVIVPTMMSLMSAQADQQLLAAQFDADDLEPARPDEPPPSEIQPGIDESKHSTLTWIGYNEYQEHLAQLAEVEQAAFTDVPPGDPVPTRQPAPDAPPLPEAETPAETTSEAPQMNSRSEAAIAEEVDAFVEALTQAVPVDATAPTESGAQVEMTATDAQADLLAQMSEVLSMIEKAAAARRAIAARTSNAPEPGRSSAEPTETAQETDNAAPPAAPPPTPPAPDQTAGESEPAEIAQQESDATSIVEIPFDQVKLGKPIARPGLELRPARPSFTVLQKITSTGRNPVVEIHFAQNGKPARAVMLRGTGHPGLDDAIISSLYRWRAAGSDLERLGPEGTLPIRIRIVIHPRSQ